MKKSPIHIGCCGFRWSQSKYFQTFKVVEVQHTFYQPPQIKTLEKWRAEAPADFEFTIKAWQRITHLGNSPTYKKIRKPLSDEEIEGCGHFQANSVVESAMRATLECAAALRAEKILFQCPPSFTPTEENIENLRRFFKKAPRGKNMRYLWEPRGKWSEALIYELCEELSLTHVVNPFKDAPVTGRLYYYRIHGRGGKQVYSDEDLRELVEAIVPGVETYVLFNNVYMIQDAERFKKLL